MASQILGTVKAWAARAGEDLVDLIAPPTCPASGERVAAPLTLGARPWAAIDFIDAPFCEVCGAPFNVDYGADVLCPSCIAEPPVFDRARAALVYNDASAKLVLGLKHSDRTETAPMFGAWMARAGKSFKADGALIAPVPLHSRRLLSRRYNQSALLAAEVSKRLGLPFSPDLLQRVRATPPQKELSAGARKRNVAGAFRVHEKRSGALDNACVILVDDVLTTGATLSACARVLKAAGARTVLALVLARVVKGGVGAI